MTVLVENGKKYQTNIRDPNEGIFIHLCIGACGGMVDWDILSDHLASIQITPPAS